VVLCGLALYFVATVLCGLSKSIGALIVMRFVQAIGCCSAVIIARAVIRDAYSAEHSARAFASTSTWLGLASVIGPILGSYLQVAFGWRAAFAALGLYSACVMALAAFHLPETNRFKNSHATRLTGLLANYCTVLGSRGFWTHALPGALSFGSIFAYISGSPFVLIDVLHVPTVWFGYGFAFAVSGYMAGTIVCRRLLSQLGTARAFRVGGAVSLAAGALFLAGAMVGAAHWTLVLAAMFLSMSAHGINTPIAQSGAISPFPQQAGTAAGLMGVLYMGAAFVVGTVVGTTHDGSVFPLALVSCTLGALIFGSMWIFPIPIPKAV
jgi:MFS transporter, DHA1 family, multidrug resistance protein